MDPSRNPGLHNAKLQTILSNWQTSQSAPSPDSESETDMSPPPAYHTVMQSPESLAEVMHRLYDAEEEDEMKGTETPEININATTQIRGHGNIISIAQMDSMRIANLLAILIHGGIPPQTQANAQAQQENVHVPGPEHRPAQEKRVLPKINININCGATVLGDRNIVGPGLGDIARHMQLAQQRQQAQQQAQRQQQQNHASPNAATTQPPRPVFGFPAPVPAPLATPPMSRSSSYGSAGSGGVKRKAEEERTETPAKKERRM